MRNLDLYREILWRETKPRPVRDTRVRKLIICPECKQVLMTRSPDTELCTRCQTRLLSEPDLEAPGEDIFSRPWWSPMNKIEFNQKFQPNDPSVQTSQPREGDGE